MTKLYEELKERNLIYQTTDDKALRDMLDNKRITVYNGFDPTADSLHLGHCVPYGVLRRMQRDGHKVVLLVGGATASIGDPSGRSDMRKLLTRKQIDSNIASIKKSLSVFLNFEGDNPAIIVNNADWFDHINYIDFMREVGVHFNINKMLANEIYANRIKEGGLTLFELGYMPMQAYDFVHLNKEYGCTLQWGGADQWGNIVAGVELARKFNFVNGTDVNLVGATNPLLVTPEGKKMGKTEKGALWIDRNKISAYDFYQGVYNTPDSCTEMMFAMFTDIPMDKVRNMIANDIVSAKKVMAYEITKMVRGEQDAIDAQNASNTLFGGGVDKSNVPTFEFDGTTTMTLADLLVATKLTASKSEARRMCEQGAVSVKGQVTRDWSMPITSQLFDDGELLVKKGKKSFVNVVLK